MSKYDNVLASFPGPGTRLGNIHELEAISVDQTKFEGPEDKVTYPKAD